MTVTSPAAVLANSLQDKLGTCDLTDHAVLAAVDGVIGEIAAQYQSRVCRLEAEIARRDAIDRYRQAVAQASVILHDRPELLRHVDLAAEMIVQGVQLADVRSGILAMGQRGSV